MGALCKNEHGMIVRARSYGNTSFESLAEQLGLKPGESLLSTGVENGVRVGRSVKPGQKLAFRPGDTFCAGPRITKAGSLPPHLKKDVLDLKAAGFGGVPEPEERPWGYEIRMNGLILPDGVRTDALVLLPSNYPVNSPIGFYLRKGANAGKLDTSHLYGRTYHNAPDLSKDGWDWFCGIADGWEPGRHGLVSYLSMVFALFNNAEQH